MPANNEVIEAVRRELERFGLKSQVAHLGKHVEVSWVLPNGQPRHTVCPNTPSDHRSSLNARAQVRRMMRADNVEVPPLNVTSFERAMSLPKPVEPPPIRIQRLEDDLSVMLDWLAEVREELASSREEAAHLRSLMDNVQVSVSFGGGRVITHAKAVEVPAEPAPFVHPTYAGGPSAKIMNLLANGAWVHRQTIAKETAVDLKTVSSTLQYLSKDGRVENGLRGFWRKKPGQEAAPAEGSSQAV